MPAAVDAQTAKARAMSEGDLFNEVTTLLKGLGWRYHHVPATAYRKNHIRSGFPDIMAVRDGRLLFIELKREKEKLTIEQAEWMHDLLMVFARNAGARHFVWRPSNLLSGEIAEILAGNR